MSHTYVVQSLAYAVGWQVIANPSFDVLWQRHIQQPLQICRSLIERLH